MNACTALVLLLATLALPAVSSAGEAELEWDQERVTALAQDLIPPLEALKADLESRPPVPGKEAARAATMDVVERLRARAGELAEQLARGADRAETAALLREIIVLRREAEKLTGAYPPRFEMHTHTDKLQRTTTQLARYYGESTDRLDGLLPAAP